MKKIILLIISMSILFCSCEMSGNVEVSRNRLEFDAEGGQDFITSNGAWGFDEGGNVYSGIWRPGTAQIKSEKGSKFDYLVDDWVSATFEKATGDIVVTVTSTDQESSRQYKFSVWHADVRAIITINQKGKP